MSRAVPPLDEMIDGFLPDAAPPKKQRKATAAEVAYQQAVTSIAEAAVGAEDDAPDNHRNAPRPSADCLYGLIGDIAAAGSDATEANPFAIAANAIAYMGCAVGRGPYMPIGNTWHHARLNTLHIGRSGEGRKGDAVSLVKRIAHRVRDMDEHGAQCA